MAWNFREYSGVVEEPWKYHVGKLLEALQKVKEDSIKFNKEVFGNIFRRKKQQSLDSKEFKENLKLWILWL